MGKYILFAIIILTALLFFQVSALNESQSLMQPTQEKINNINYNENGFAIAVATSNLTDDDAVMGNPNAPVTMVEFGGFEETFSRLFWSNTFPTIKSQYIDTGKVKFVFRDFPLVELFPFDGYAAVAAECVHQQGGNTAYFQMWNSLYNTNQVFDEEVINQLALNLGYNITNCLEQGDIIDEVVLDIVDAMQLGIEGSPSFFINGELTVGAQPTDVFQAAIEQALNESVACFSNAQCNDSNQYTFDTCTNPGQLNATCTHQAIQCIRNNDCGNTSDVKYCSINAICTKTTSYICISPGTPQSSCTSSVGESCGSCSFGCNNQSLMCKPSPIIALYSPIEKIYNIASIPLNLTIGNDSFMEISLIDWNEKRHIWTILCRNCNEHGFKKKVMKSFDEGTHNLTFKGVNGNITITKNVSFFIDSKDPKISATLPKSKSFTNGSNFYIKYSENNCQSLLLNIYGNTANKTVNMNCSSGANIEKTINDNLISFNNQEVEYQFIIKDIANNSVESRKTKIRVDTTKPIINSFINFTNARRITFTLNVTEFNFDKVNYIDYNDTRPTERILCSSLKSGICSSTKTLRAGQHNITITVLDEAGNSVQRVSNFNLI